MVIAMKRLKRIVLIFAAVPCCFVMIVALVSLTHPLIRLSVFRLLPREWSTRLIDAIPSPLFDYLAKRASPHFARSARLEGFLIRWTKLREDIVFTNGIAFCLQPTYKCQCAWVGAFKTDDGVALWTCSVPNPVWEKGLSTKWKLLAWQDEVWAVPLSAGKINALDSKSGKLLWEHDFGFPIWGMHQGKEVAFIIHGKSVLCFEPKARQALVAIMTSNSSSPTNSCSTVSPVTIHFTLVKALNFSQ